MVVKGPGEYEISDIMIRGYASKGYDVVLIEVGGTVGDSENIPFLFAVFELVTSVSDKFFESCI